MARTTARRQPLTAAEAAVLQAALAAEHAAVYGYGIVGAHLTGAAFTAARADWVAHQVARDTLESMLRSAGLAPVAAAVAYRPPQPVHGSATAISLAVTLENRVAAAYLDLVAAVSPGVRKLGAREVVAAAIRAASWRGRTVAFPGFPPGMLGLPKSAGSTSGRG